MEMDFLGNQPPGLSETAFAATPAARFGIEYARTEQTYVDGVDAINTRLQLSAFLVF